MDIGKAFTYTFDDEGWLTKVLIGGLFSVLSIILIGIPFIVGYFLETLKNVYLGQPRPLPNWGDNLGALFVKGIKAMVGILIWSLPIILLSCVFAIVSGSLGAAMPSGNSSAAQGAAGVFVVVNLCFQCLIFLYSLVLTVVLPAAFMRFAVNEKISDFLAFGELFGFISRNLSNYIIAIIIYWIASFVASFGVILCIVGVLLTTFWSMLVSAHVFGQVYRNANAV
jgi:hypothetical protein